MQKRLQVNISVHHAQPNTAYDVDIRSWHFGPQQANWKSQDQPKWDGNVPDGSVD